VGQPPPPSGVRLAHRTEGFLHHVRLDGIVQGGESPVAVPLTKDLDNWDGIIPSLQVWVRIVLQSELFPASLMLVHGIGPLTGNTRSDVIVSNGEISKECIHFESGKIRRGRVWGMKNLNDAKKFPYHWLQSSEMTLAGPGR
jgi:hypothetical protein